MEEAESLAREAVQEQEAGKEKEMADEEAKGKDKEKLVAVRQQLVEAQAIRKEAEEKVGAGGVLVGRCVCWCRC